MIVSPGSVDDAPRVAALFRACFDDRVITVAGIRHRQIERPTGGRAAVLARRGGWRADRLVVRGPRCVRRCAHDGVRGHRRPSGPSPRRSRLGALGRWSPAISTRSALVASSPTAGQMPDSVAFARARGFSLESTDTTSAVDPRTLAPPPEPPAGIAIAPMAEYERRPDAGVRGRQGKRSRRAGPGRFLGHDVRDLAPPDLGRAGLRPRR